MKTIKEIINNLQDLESEFNLFNSRIFEFAKSTNKWDIDKSLLEKYINSINGYIKLIWKYKEEVSKMNEDKADFGAQKDLVLFRLEKIWKIFNNTLKKLTIINGSIVWKTKSKKTEVKIDFDSRDEMQEINKYLYEFYNNYNKNLEFQKKYNIDISLDDAYEARVEKMLWSLKLIKQENKYVINLNNIFETIEELDVDFNTIFKETIDVDKRFFSNFMNQYLLEKKWSFVFQKFNEFFSDKYVNKTFDLTESAFNIDNNNFKLVIKKEYKNLNILKILFSNIKKYKLFKSLNKKYELFKDFSFFEEKHKIFTYIAKKDYKNAFSVIKDIKIKIKSNNTSVIEKNNDIFKSSLELLENYNLISKEYVAKLSFGFMWSLFDVFDKTKVSDKYIQQWLLNVAEKFNKELKTVEFTWNDIKDLRNFLKIIKKYNKHLKEIKKNIDSLETYLLTWIKYSYGSTLKKYKSSMNTKLNNLRALLFLSTSLLIKNEFEDYISTVLSTRFSVAKKRYYAAKRARSSSSSSSSRSWSSSSSSSWSSSSSSSFSSSYSSSGSSSW